MAASHVLKSHDRGSNLDRQGNFRERSGPACYRYDGVGRQDVDHVPRVTHAGDDRELDPPDCAFVIIGWKNTHDETAVFGSTPGRLPPSRHHDHRR